MNNKKPTKKVSEKNEGYVFRYFFIGIIMVVVIQTVFMLGGLFVENALNINITGIPSALGLTIVLFIGLYLLKKNEYILLGSFTLAFISPLILLIIIIFKTINFDPIIYFSIAYMSLIILTIWIYYIVKIFKESF